jgi:hypothetical protein
VRTTATVPQLIEHVQQSLGLGVNALLDPFQEPTVLLPLQKELAHDTRVALDRGLTALLLPDALLLEPVVLLAVEAMLLAVQPMLLANLLHELVAALHVCVDPVERPVDPLEQLPRAHATIVPPRDDGESALL